MTIELRVLGPTQLGPDEAPVTLGGAKQRAVLALLVARFGRAVDADLLVDAIWRDDAMPSRPRRTIQVYVSNLRQLLRPRSIDIVGTANGYRLAAERSVIDILQFEDHLAAAASLRRDDRAAALDRLVAAETLWRGRAYVGLAIDELEREAERIETLRLGSVTDRLGLEVYTDQRPRAIHDLRRFLEQHPSREDAAAHLMTGLALEHRHPEALQVLHVLRERLADIGLEPSPSLGELEVKILRHEIHEQPADITPAPIPIERPKPLTFRTPHLISRFVGRHHELDRVIERCTSNRWVTVIGPGGVGKTRLAIEAARRGAFPSIFVSLADTDAVGVIPSIIRATQLPVAPGCSIEELVSSFADHAGDEHVLLVLDNAEHVADQLVDVASALLRGVEGLRVLVTSRDRLGVAGESTVPLAPLDDDDALALFTDRISLNGQVLDTQDDEAVTQVRGLCRAVDNLPLAIEMAATRTRTLQISEIVARLDNPFALLAAEMRNELSQHRSLLGTIEWSYDRLEPVDRLVFDRLSMFPNGCTLETAEAVCRVDGDDFAAGDLVEIIARLVDHSMITADHTSLPSRFRMLATVRQFGVERFASSPRASQVRLADATWASALATAAYFEFLGVRPQPGQPTLDAQIDNVRVAFEMAVADGLVEALEIAVWLSYVRMTRAEFATGVTWIRQALDAVAPVPEDDRVTAYRAAAELFFQWWCSILESRIDGAAEAIDECLEVLSRFGDEPLFCLAVTMAAGHASELLMDPGRALRIVELGFRHIEAARNPLSTAQLNGLASLARLRLGQFDEVRDQAQLALDLAIELSSDETAYLSMKVLIMLAWRLDDREEVRRLAGELDVMDRRQAQVGGFKFSGSYWLAALAIIEGDTERAARMVGEELDRPGVESFRQAWVALRGLLLRRTGDVEQAASELRTSMPEPFVAFTPEVATLWTERGWCELALGDLDAAERCFAGGVAAGIALRDPYSQAAGLEGGAAVAFARGDRATAVRLLGDADELRAIASARLNLHQPDVDDLRAHLAAPSLLGAKGAGQGGVPRPSRRR